MDIVRLSASILTMVVESPTIDLHWAHWNTTGAATSPFDAVVVAAAISTASPFADVSLILASPVEIIQINLVSETLLRPIPPAARKIKWIY